MVVHWEMHLRDWKPYAYILYSTISSLGALCIANLAIGVMEPTLPIWMMETMCSPNWELGTCYAKLVPIIFHIATGS